MFFSLFGYGFRLPYTFNITDIGQIASAISEKFQNSFRRGFYGVYNGLR